MSAVVSYLLMILLLLTALVLIVLVLIQRGKGGGLSGAFGGMGGQSAFGTKAGDLFTKITIGVAAFWIVLCIISVRVLGISGGGLLSQNLGRQPSATERPRPAFAAKTARRARRCRGRPPRQARPRRPGKWGLESRRAAQHDRFWRIALSTGRPRRDGRGPRDQQPVLQAFRALQRRLRVRRTADRGSRAQVGPPRHDPSERVGRPPTPASTSTTSTSRYCCRYRRQLESLRQEGDALRTVPLEALLVLPGVVDEASQPADRRGGRVAVDRTRAALGDGEP